MQISPRKIRFGLLVLAVFLGGVLPTLFSLLGDSDVLAVSLPVSAAFGILLFLAQSAPLFFGFVGGYLIMAAAMLSRIPLYAAQPLLITGYEILCFLGFPLILIGLSRLWLRMALSIRLAFLFSALSLLSVFLLMQCGWSFMVDALDAQGAAGQSALPELPGVLLSLFVECSAYALLRLCFHDKERDQVSFNI